jgi:hypothetical protein
MQFDDHIQPNERKVLTECTCGTAQSAWIGSQTTEHEQSQSLDWTTNNGALQKVHAVKKAYKHINAVC